MVNGRTRGAMQHVVRIFQEGTLAGLPDREILARFVDVRDEAAFEVLLARHGPMVLNVCRQILRGPDDAEDAFQATFLALACKAGTLHVDESLGPWLYRVASRVAARARADRRRRSDRERSGVPVPEPEPARDDGSSRDEIARVVHEELGRLPERLRAPIVLCYLEGMTHEQAARQLRCPVGTVRSRLARARDRLRGRIARLGVVTSPATLGAVLAANGRASAIPPHVSQLLVKVAAQLAAGTASLRGGCGVSARVAALLEGVLNVLSAKQLVGSMAALAAVAIVATVATLSVFSASGQTGGVRDPRPIGPDGRRIGPREGEETYVKTYYVGDLLSLKGPVPGERSMRSANGNAVTERRWVDMSPVIDLITSMAARGTWTIDDADGKEIAPSDASGKRGPVGRRRSATVGRITPFFLSLSVIVRQTREGHDEVADLLRKLRRLVGSLENPSGTEGQRREVEEMGLTPRAASAAPIPAVDRKARIGRLLDELRREVESLPKDGD